MLRSTLLATILFLSGLVLSQEKKSISAMRISVSPKIDGVLADSAWLGSQPGTDFIQYELHPGEASRQRTEVKILYDDEAIYVGAELYDTAPDSILRELSTRDNEPNADLFGIMLDTYNDDINAFGFYVTPAGTQLDARYSSEGQDMDWNAVWMSAVKIHEKGWTVEIKIPYSALRFARLPNQTWGINIMRKIRRLREMSFWNFFDPRIEAMVRQFGDLTDLNNIKPPPRLSVTPYLAGIVNHFPYADPEARDLSSSLSGGMDVKYGISDAFTLDMTLVPDFSQVQSDNLVLNLSPFEVQYQERRPFFTEGTELFNKMGLFYSRRVGGTPIDYYKPYENLGPGESVVRNPTQTRLINATKFSGRTKQKTGIGIFNAISAESHAEIKDAEGQHRQVLTSPLTNYNIVVLDQALKNNSSLSFVNTNVTRKAGHYDANVAALGLRLNNKSNTYTFGSSAKMSSRLFPSRPAPEQGYAADIDFGKSGGNFRWSVFGRLKTDKYNPNDLGILFLTNNMETGIDLQYNIYKPFWRQNNIYNFVRIIYQRMYVPNAFWNFGIYGNSNTTFTKRFVTCGVNYGIEPVVTADYYEPRVPFRYYAFPVNYSGGAWVSTDYRKRFAIDFGGWYRDFKENNRNTVEAWMSPRYRVNNKLSFVYEISDQWRTDDIGFVNYDPDSARVTFGRRDMETVSNIFSGIYKFNNRMSLSFRLRHYWSQATYRAYSELMEDGTLREYDYQSDHNVNFNAFNIDMVFFWQFAPGSELNIVWKDAVLKSESATNTDYYTNFRGSFSSEQNNMISLKVLYYLDYLQVRSQFRQKKSRV